MYIYTVEAMRGQKAKPEGDPIKCRIGRVNTDIPMSKKGHLEFIRENLDYEVAMAQIQLFNDMERKSQVKRKEVAREREGL